MSDDDRILLLSPERDRLAQIVPGSVVIDADCGHRAWISPAGLQMQLGGMIDRTECSDCVNPAKVSELQVGPGQREDLAALLGPEAADQLIAEAQRDPARTVRQVKRSHRPRRR